MKKIATLLLRKHNKKLFNSKRLYRILNKLNRLIRTWYNQYSNHKIIKMKITFRGESINIQPLNLLLMAQCIIKRNFK